MNPFPLIWIGLGVAGAVAEYAAFRTRKAGSERIDTLSRNVQWLLADRSKPVRILAILGWFGFAVWFWRHIW